MATNCHLLAGFTIETRVLFVLVVIIVESRLCAFLVRGGILYIPSAYGKANYWLGPNWREIFRAKKKWY